MNQPTLPPGTVNLSPQKWREKRPKYRALAGCRDEIVRRYLAKESVESLAAEFGVGISGIYYHLKVADVPRTVGHRSRCTFDETVFDGLPNCAAAAYFCGLLLADGSIGRQTSSGCPTVSLCLQASDIELVKAFREFLKSDHKIEVRQTGGFGGKNLTARISVTSMRLAGVLAKWGVVPRKSGREEAHPLMATNPHFWRGCVDGDGWVSLLRQKGHRHMPAVGLTGSLQLMEQFRAFVLSLSPQCRGSIHRNHSIWMFTTTGTYAVPVIRSLYDHECPSLERKSRVAREMFSWESRTPRLGCHYSRRRN